MDLFLDMEVIKFVISLSNINPYVTLIFITIHYNAKYHIVSFIKTPVNGLLALITVEVYIIFVAFCLICHPIKVTYRVNIKSFPDYKYFITRKLLYVEYKHIFFKM